LALVACLSASAGVVLTTFAVNPTQGFLYQSSNDTTSTALFISLNCTNNATNCINAAAGTSITILGLGAQCFFAPVSGPCTESPALLGGIFDTTNSLVASSTLSMGNVDRLGATTLNAGQPDISNVSYLNTFVGGVNTTIPNDFFIPDVTGLTVVVPTGANYLVVGVLDSLYGDNTDASHTLGVQITQNIASVPEPATVGFMGAGLAGLALWRRRRSR